MDPNENLKEQLETAKGIISTWDEKGMVDSIDTVRLAELVIVLDEWLSKGGMMPERWER